MPRKPRKEPGLSLPKPDHVPAAIQALSGTEVIFVVCPLCGRSRILEVTSERARAKGKSRLRWNYWNEGSPIIQIRVGGGKKPKALQPGFNVNGGLGFSKKRYSGIGQGSGFHTKEILSWEQAKEQPGLQDQILAIQNQIQKLNLLCQ